MQEGAELQVFTVSAPLRSKTCLLSIGFVRFAKFFSSYLPVVVKPQVSVTPRRMIVGVADTVTFRCSASVGFPAATLRWERGDGRRLPDFSKFFSRSGIFKIWAASRPDEGEYLCTASNSGGESVMRVQLLVRGREPLVVGNFHNDP